MKTLIVYYSRSNVTKKVAESLQEKLGCDIEEIKPKVNYQGKIGYVRGIKDAIAEKIVDYENLQYDPSEYDTVIMGAPVWASKSANPLISYIDKNEGKFKDVKLFITAGSSGFESTIKQINSHLGFDASGSISIRTIDVKNDNYMDLLDKLIK